LADDMTNKQILADNTTNKQILSLCLRLYWAKDSPHYSVCRDVSYNHGGCLIRWDTC
jgi:hypothetical protein